MPHPYRPRRAWVRTWHRGRNRGALRHGVYVHAWGTDIGIGRVQATSFPLFSAANALHRTMLQSKE